MGLGFYPCLESDYPPILIVATDHGRYQRYLENNIARLAAEISDVKPVLLWEKPDFRRIGYPEEELSDNTGWEDPLYRLGSELIYVAAFVKDPDLLSTIAGLMGRNNGPLYAKELFIWFAFINFIYQDWVSDLVRQLTECAPPNWLDDYLNNIYQIYELILAPYIHSYQDIFEKSDWVRDNEDILKSCLYQPLAEVILPGLLEILLPYIYNPEAVAIMNRELERLEKNKSSFAFWDLRPILRHFRDKGVVEAASTYPKERKLIVMAGSSHYPHMEELLHENDINTSIVDRINSNDYERDTREFLDLFLNKQRCFKFT